MLEHFWMDWWSCPEPSLYSLGVVRNLVSFFHLRCCGLFKPAIIDWTQQFPPGRDQHVFGHTDMVWPPRHPSLRVKGQTFTVVLDQKHKVYLFIFLSGWLLVKRYMSLEVGKNTKRCVDIVSVALCTDCCCLILDQWKWDENHFNLGEVYKPLKT